MHEINPVGLIGRFIPEEEDTAWSQYVNQYCMINEATFFNAYEGELEVSFDDGVSLTIQLEEFTLI